MKLIRNFKFGVIYQLTKNDFVCTKCIIILNFWEEVRKIEDLVLSFKSPIFLTFRTKQTQKRFRKLSRYMANDYCQQIFNYLWRKIKTTLNIAKISIIIFFIFIEIEFCILYFIKWYKYQDHCKMCNLNLNFDCLFKQSI